MDYKLDNDQVFPDSPSTLGDLRHFLRVVLAEITEYTVWSVSKRVLRQMYSGNYIDPSH